MSGQRTSDESPQGISVALGCCTELIGRGLVQVLQESKHITLVARDLDMRALERSVVRRAPVVVILEEDMVPTQHLRALASSAAVVVLAHKPTHRRRRALEASGAICIPAQATGRELLTTIRRAAGGRAAPLTPREQEVLGHLQTGQATAQEIADDMQISVATVRTHIASIRRKLGVRRKRELIVSVASNSKRQ